MLLCVLWYRLVRKVSTDAFCIGLCFGYRRLFSLFTGLFSRYLGLYVLLCVLCEGCVCCCVCCGIVLCGKYRQTLFVQSSVLVIDGSFLVMQSSFHNTEGIVLCATYRETLFATTHICRSLLQNIVSFIGLFCKRDL